MHTGQDCFVAIFRRSEQLRAQAEQLIKAHDLQPVQYNVLRILRGAGAEGLSCQGIGERLLSRGPDITRLVDRLVKQGYVERHQHPNDRRSILVAITEAGRNRITAIDEPLADCHEQQFTKLSHDEREQLLTLLNRL